MAKTPINDLLPSPQFAGFLDFARAHRGSLSKLAAMAGVSRMMVSLWTQGKRRLPVAIARALPKWAVHYGYDKPILDRVDQALTPEELKNEEYVLDLAYKFLSSEDRKEAQDWAAIRGRSMGRMPLCSRSVARMLMVSQNVLSEWRRRDRTGNHKRILRFESPVKGEIIYRLRDVLEFMKDCTGADGEYRPGLPDIFRARHATRYLDDQDGRDYRFDEWKGSIL